MQTQQLFKTLFFMLLTGTVLMSSVTRIVYSDEAPPQSLQQFLSKETAEQRAASAIRCGQERSAASIGQLTKWLSDESTLVRQSAAWALTQMGDAAESALPQLKQAIADRDARVRWAAATALGQLGSKGSSAESVLLQAARDRDADVQCAALIALRSIRVSDLNTTLSALIECAQSGIADVQSEAMATLSALAPKANEDVRQQTAQSLIPALRAGNNEVRLAASVLLGELGLSAAPAIPVLAQVTSDQDEYVRAAACRALERFAEEIDRNWNHLDESRQNILQRPCELAAQTLSSSPRVAISHVELANRFDQLVDGIRLTSATKSNSAAKQIAHTFNDHSKTPSVVEHVLSEPNPTTIAAEQIAATTATANPASSSSHGAWLWGMGTLVTLAGLWMLFQGNPRNTAALPQGQTSSDAPSNHDDHSVNVAQATAISVVESHSAEADMIDAHVLPAVMASLPTAHEAAEPIPQIDVAKRRETENSPADSQQDALAQFVTALQDKDARVRAAAAFSLSKLNVHAVAAVPELCHALADDFAAVRARAAFALGQIGPAAKMAVRELSRLVSDPDPAVRRNAISALGGIGDEAATALPELLRAASDSDVGVRRTVISVLAMLGPSTAEPIFERALSDKDSDVRQFAQMALQANAERSNTTSVETIALSRTTQPQQQAHESADPPAANPTANAAPRLKIFWPDETNEAEQPKIESNNASSNVSNERLAIAATSEADEAAVLISQLDSADSNTRWQATQSLGQLGGDAVPSIVAQLDHPNPETRRLLITALNRIGATARDALPALLQATSDPHPAVRCAATECLGRLGVINRPLLQTLIKRLTDSDAEVRRYAATTLGRFGQYAREASVDLKVAALGDSEAKVRTAAHAALQRIINSISEVA